MERKLIESIINGIVRQNRDNVTIVLDGIALLLCRNNRHEIRSHLSNKEFDFENLFIDGIDAVKHIQEKVPEEQQKLLYKNFALSSEVLLDYIQAIDFRFFTQKSSVNKGVSQLTTYFLKPKKNDFIYNPFGGDYYAPIAYPDTRFLSDFISQKENRYFQLVMAAKCQENVITRTSNPFLCQEDEKERYELIYIPALPFGMRIAGMGRKIEENFVLRMMKILVPGGRMVVVLPSMALSSDNYFELRKTLADTGYLRSITLLGAGAAFRPTGIATAIFEIVKERNASGSFYLYNATSFDIGNAASLEKLCEKIDNKASEISSIIEFHSLFTSHNAQIINPSAKLSRIERPGFKNVKLRKVLEHYSNSAELDGTTMVPRLSGKDMHIELPEYMIDVQDVEVAKAVGRYTRINKPVFCFHGITLNCLWCIGEEDLPIYCNSDIYTFTIRENEISPEYLCFVLNEDDIAADIKSHIAGARIQRISRESLLDIEIPIPDENRKDLFCQEMERFISERKTRLLKKEKESNKERLEDIKDDIEDKKHLLGPYNFNIQSALNRVLKLLSKGQTLTLDTKAFKDSSINLYDYLDAALKKSKTAGFITASIGGDIFELVERPLDSFIFLKEYQKYLASDDGYRDIEIQLAPIAAPYALMIDEKALYLVLDTIVRNAVSHGFSDPFYGKKRILISINEAPTPGFAILSIANNGNPVAEDFSEDLFCRKFGKCGEHAHTGRGGYFVKKAMDFYKGDVSIETTDNMWTFMVKLLIPTSHD